MITSISEVLTPALQQLGTEWMNYQVAEIRNALERVTFLVNINTLVTNGVIDASELKIKAPEFCSVYENVMLRDIVEGIPNGDEY